MSNGLGTIAGILAGLKAGEITEAMAVKLLRELGADKEVASLLGLAAGVAGGFLMGDILGDAASDIFDGLF